MVSRTLALLFCLFFRFSNCKQGRYPVEYFICPSVRPLFGGPAFKVLAWEPWRGDPGLTLLKENIWLMVVPCYTDWTAPSLFRRTFAEQKCLKLGIKKIILWKKVFLIVYSFRDLVREVSIISLKFIFTCLRFICVLRSSWRSGSEWKWVLFSLFYYCWIKQTVTPNQNFSVTHLLSILRHQFSATAPLATPSTSHQTYIDHHASIWPLYLHTSLFPTTSYVSAVIFTRSLVLLRQQRHFCQGRRSRQQRHLRQMVR